MGIRSRTLSAAIADPTGFAVEPDPSQVAAGAIAFASGGKGGGSG